MKGNIGKRNEKSVISQLGFVKRRSRKSLFTSIAGTFVSDKDNAGQGQTGQVYNIETRKINEEARKMQTIREKYEKRK